MAYGGQDAPTTTPRKPKRQPQAPRGENAAVAKPAPQQPPAAPAGDNAAQKPITGPPVAALTQFGYFGSIADFARRVEAVVGAHQNVFGYPPSPGLTFDVARAPVHDDHIPALFDPVASDAIARASRVLRTAAAEPTPAQESEKLLGAALEAIRNHTYDDFLKDNEDAVTGLLRSDKRAAAKIGVALYEYDNQADTPEEAAALGPDLGFAVKAASITGLAGKQVAYALKESPAGVYLTGKAAVFDAQDIAAAMHGGSGRSPTRTFGIAKQSVEGVKRDVQHPAENPGYLFIDILGLTGAGAGAAVRVGAAGKLVARGELAAGAKALATRPVGGTVEIRKGGMTEQVLASENPVVRAWQRTLIGRRNRAMTLRHEGGDSYPAGILSVVLPEKAGALLDKHFSSETKVGREMAARKRVDHVIAMTTARELDAAAGWSVNQARVLSKVPSKARRGLTLGEQKAIQVASVDDPNPLQAMRSFHEWAIAHEIGDEAAHRFQLGALDLAEKAMKNPRPRFQKALALTRQAVAEQQAIKIAELGLSPITAESRVTRVGDIYRRDPLAATGQLKIPAEAPKPIGTRPRPRTEQEARQRLAELDAKYESLVSKVIPEVSPFHPGEQARRNRMGSGAAPLVSSEERALAEQKIMETALAHPKEASSRLVLERHQLEQVLNPDLFEQIDVGKLGTVNVPFYAAEAAPKAGRQSAGSFYLPSVSKAKTRRQPQLSGEPFRPRAGPYGIPAPVMPPELTHTFTGQSILSGDFRIDATGLASEAYARTVKAATVLQDYNHLLDASTPTKVSKFDVPIREKAAIPDDLRVLLSRVDDGEFTAEDASHLRPDDLKAMYQHLFPDATADIKGVRWVDSRLISNDPRFTARIPPAAQKTMQAINEPFRLTTLFLRPAYILNALGNAAMGIMHQGVFLPPNMIRAIHAKHLYGEKVARTLDSLAGEGRALGYVAPEVDTVLTRTSTALARGWSIVADQFFRRAAMIHELRRMGAHDQAGMERLLFDETNRTELVQASKRANKAMVEFNNLTWYEKNLFRHLIFVYPWVSRSAVWSVRTMLEHPVQTAVLVQLGRIAGEQQDNDPVLSHTPEWFRRTGYIPVGFNENGSPKVINPTSINSFSTVSELLEIGQAGAAGDQYASFEDILGPFARFVIHGATGRDEFGNAYPGSQWAGSARGLIEGLPQVSAQERAAKQNPPLKAIDASDRRTLVEREHSALKDTVFSPGWLGGYGSLISGGLTARVVNPDAATARYWRDQPPKVRHAHEQTLVLKALDLQGELLGRSVPREVRAAVTLAGKRTAAYSEFQTRTGRDPTMNERTNIDIQVLRKTGHLTDGEAAQFSAKLARTVDPSSLTRLRNGLLSKYAGGNHLRAWDADVRLVHSFRPEILRARFGQLDDQGLTRGAAALAESNQGTLTRVARQYVDYTHEVRKRVAENKAVGSTAEGMAAIRAWQDAQDKPIVVGGKRFPSPVRIAWTLLTPEQQQAARHQNAVAAWKNLSAFDKELIGVKSSAKITEAWAQYAKISAQYRADQPPGERRLPPGYPDVIARYVDKNIAPGFYRDWSFARRPLYDRLAVTSLVRDSANSAEWDSVLALAKQVRAYKATAARRGLTGSQVRDYWADYVTNALLPWMKRNPSFEREVGLFGPKMLYHLIN